MPYLVSSAKHADVCLQLVEAKLKRAYQEGQAARAAGQDPLAAELAATAHRLRMQAATLIPTAPLVVTVGNPALPGCRCC